jgi:hypothetical protein
MLPVYMLAQSSMNWTLGLLGLSALLLYLTGRVAVSCLPRRMDGPVARALLFMFPVSIASIGAVLINRPVLAIHLPIAVAVYCMTLGASVLMLFHPGVGKPEFAGRRSWTLLLPAALMILIAGFAGSIDGLVAACLIVYGFFALMAWSNPPERAKQNQLLLEYEAGKAPPQTSASSSILMLLPIALLMVVAVVAALYVLPEADKQFRTQADSVLVMFILAPAIIVPKVFELLPPARVMSFNDSMSSLALTAMLCLCVVVPCAAGLKLLAPPVVDYSGAGLSAQLNAPPGNPPTTRPASAPARPAVAPANVESRVLRIPVDVWRIDALALVIACLLLVPIAAGLFRVGLTEAVGLLLLYAIYFLVRLVAMRY